MGELSVLVILAEVVVAIIIAWIVTPKIKRITSLKGLMKYLSDWFIDDSSQDDSDDYMHIGGRHNG